MPAEGIPCSRGFRKVLTGMAKNLILSGSFYPGIRWNQGIKALLSRGQVERVGERVVLATGSSSKVSIESV